MTEGPKMTEGHREVSLVRTAHGTYRATNSRGGEITIGDGTGGGDFTPVELLLAAIAGCSAIDIDYIVSQRAEPDAFSATATGRKVRDAEGNHLVDLDVAFELDFGAAEGAERAEQVVQRSIDQSRDRLCTVARTVQLGTPVTMHRR